LVNRLLELGDFYFDDCVSLGITHTISEDHEVGGHGTIMLILKGFYS